MSEGGVDDKQGQSLKATHEELFGGGSAKRQESK